MDKINLEKLFKRLKVTFKWYLNDKLHWKGLGQGQHAETHMKVSEYLKSDNFAFNQYDGYSLSLGELWFKNHSKIPENENEVLIYDDEEISDDEDTVNRLHLTVSNWYCLWMVV
ncbi:hypothetical protein BpHYR1_003488 [Brachionus plicatilis]|uniref:Uncharacterized protein n=1 Tax=Brachionus plicatilis TaxID=10195 RepID=A0A3M7T0U2_BRAPC|nr:hypothetical protein BpHYR1_003488 [Brachionus plicatilis]